MKRLRFSCCHLKREILFSSNCVSSLGSVDEYLAVDNDGIMCVNIFCVLLAVIEYFTVGVNMCPNVEKS